MRALRAAALPLALLALTALPAAHAAFGLPDALTSRGQTVGHIYDTIVLMGIVVFLIVFAWLVVVIWRFRETTGHGRATHEKERHSIKAELAWFLIPLVMVLYIGGIAYAGLMELDHGIDPASVPAEDQLRIVGHQWDWEADYSNGVVVHSSPDPLTGMVKNESVFYVPQDTPLLFNITSADVIHAFQLLDANRGFVIFNDANPLGANKYNLQTASLPGGNYTVQCNKMCLNPGHAIMRARIKAVPKDTYALWLNGEHAKAGASIVQSVELAVQGGHLVGPDGKAVPAATVVTSERVVLHLPAPPQDVTFTLDGQVKTIHAGEAVDPFFAFTADHAGTYVVRSSTGDALNFTAVNAETAQVTLNSYSLTPDALQLQSGHTYLVTLPNISATVHDLYIGHYNQGGATADVKWHSQPVGGGSQGAFLVTPDAAGTFDMWCNQPGHHGLGMAGTVTIS